MSTPSFNLGGAHSHLRAAEKNAQSKAVRNAAEVADVIACFYGKVLGTSASVRGLLSGEIVVGFNGRVTTGQNFSQDVGPNQCIVQALFTDIWPIPHLVDARVNIPSVIAQLSGSVASLMCATQKFNLKMGEAILLIAPRLSHLLLLVQRLAILAADGCWHGPLFVIVLSGDAPVSRDFETHPLIFPLMSSLESASVSDRSRRVQRMFQGLLGFSAEQGVPPNGNGKKQELAPWPTTASTTCAIDDIIASVVGGPCTGVGVDVVVCLGGPGFDCQASCATASTVSVRSLIGSLAIDGRLVTDCVFEFGPTEVDHLRRKCATVSLIGPQCGVLAAFFSRSPSSSGIVMHAIGAILGGIATGDIPVIPSGDVSVLSRMSDALPGGTKQESNMETNDVAPQSLFGLTPVVIS